jgi:hypothetical protein
MSWWSGRGARAFALVALGFGVIAASPRAARAEPYKDEKLGFSINAPAKWKRLPLAPDEKWIAASFSGDREFEVSDPKTSSYDRHRPQLDVVILPKSETEKKGGVTVTETDEGKAISLNKAEYKDFKDYLDKTAQRFGDGGYFFSEPGKESKFGTMKVMFYEITFDKLANAPKKRWGWAFYADDAIYGVTGDALIKFEDKVRPDIEAAFRSFKIFAHSAALGNAATGQGGDITIVDKTKKLTPAEKKKKREDEFNAYLARVKETLPDGWKIKETKHYVCVTHCDDKFTKEMIDHAEALRDWFDESLAFLGDDVPGKAIIRLCADQNEQESMWKTGGWTSYKFEAYAHKDRESTVDSRLWELNSGLFRIWLSNKNDELRGRLPVWVDYGLRDCITNATSKGGKIQFKNSGYENERLATARRAGKLISAKDFLTKGTEDLRKMDEVRLQAQCFALYLLQGGAQKNPKYKNILSDYLKNFVAMLKEKDAKPDDASGAETKEPTSEAEENAAFAARENKWKEEERKVLDELIQKTFSGWEEKDWDAFNKSFAKELGA